MKHLTQPKYDRYREFISIWRNMNISWKEIQMARKSTLNYLANWLNARNELDKLPIITPNEWFTIVESKKLVDENSQTLEKINPAEEKLLNW